MFKTRVAAGIVALMALTGCSATSAPSPVEAEPVSAVVESAVVERPAPGSGMIENGTAVFLSRARANITGMANASNASLLASGYYACAQLEAGVAADKIEIGGAEEGHNALAIVISASSALCIEHIIE
jgi:hypothetical protein